MIKFNKILFYFLIAKCLIIGEVLWSNNVSNIAQCQALMEAYQTKHQSAFSFHSRQARVNHLLKILKSKPLDIAERIYLHYLSISDPDSELLRGLSDCLVKFLALNEKDDLKNLDLLNRINLGPLEKLRALDKRETGLLSRFGVEEKDFDDAVGLGVEIMRPRQPRQAIKAPPKAPVQAPIDVELIKQELTTVCELVRNIDHDQHYEDQKRINTLNIVGDFEKLVAKLGASNDVFDKLHDLTDYYKERKDSLSFDLVKRAARDICQQFSSSTLAKTPGELLAELAKLADSFKKQMVAKARAAFEDLQSTEEIKTALQLKQVLHATEKDLKDVINLADLDALILAYKAVQDYSPFLWSLGATEFLEKLNDFKRLLPKTKMTLLEDALKDFKISSNEDNAKKIKREAKKIFLPVDALAKKYLDAQKDFDPKNQLLVKQHSDAEFMKDYADHKYGTLTKRVSFARPGTIKAAKALAEEFAKKAAAYDADIEQKVAAIFEGQ